MPYLIANMLYPTDKAPEVAGKYLEAIQKYPPDENLGTEIIPAAVKSTKEGINTFAVVEVKEGKLEQAMGLVTNRMVMFQSVPGCRYQIDVYYKVEEALALIGMSAP